AIPAGVPPLDSAAGALPWQAGGAARSAYSGSAAALLPRCLGHAALAAALSPLLPPCGDGACRARSGAVRPRGGVGGRSDPRPDAVRPVRAADGHQSVSGLHNDWQLSTRGAAAVPAAGVAGGDPRPPRSATLDARRG